MKETENFKALTDVGVMNLAGISMGLISILPHLFIAWFLGFGNKTDVYFMAFASITLISELFRVGTLQKVYVSIFAKYISKENSDKINYLVTNFLFMSLIIGMLFILITFILAPIIIELMAPGFDTEMKISCVRMFRFLTPTFLYTLLFGVLMGFLHSKNIFKLTSIIQLIPVTFISLAAIIGLKRFGIYSLLWATLLGYAFQILIMLKICIKFGLKIKSNFKFSLEETKEALRMIIPFLWGGGFVQLGNYVQNLLVSFMVLGNMSILAYMRKLKTYIINYLLAPIPTICHPNMVRKINENKFETHSLVNYISKVINLSNFVISPTIIFIAVLSPQLIFLLLFHGKFQEIMAIKISISLFIMCLGALFLNTNSIIVRVLLSYRDAKSINKAKIISQVCLILISIILYRSLSIYGIIFAMMISIPIEFIINIFSTEKYIPIKKILTSKNFKKICWLNIFLFVVTIIISAVFIKLFGLDSLLGNFFQIFAIIILGASIYICGSKLLHLSELDILFSISRMFIHKRASNLNSP